VGVGIDLSLRVAELPRGSLRLEVSPFFLVGSNGNAWSLPFAIAYRFQ
jgi:hypothetical protein